DARRRGARRRCRGSDAGGGARRLRLAERRLDVGFDHAALRPAARELGEVEPGLLGHALGQRTGENAVAGTGAIGGRRRRRRRLWTDRRRRGSGCRLRRRGGGRRRLLGRFLLRRLAGAGQRFRVLALLEQQGDDRVHLDALRALGNDDLAERALVDRLDLHRRLVGLDLGQDIAGLDGLALL